MADAQLDALVTTGLAANPDVAMAVARLDQARAGVDGARAARLPRLDAAASVARERVARSSLPDADGSRTETPAFRQSRFAVQLEASYEIDVLGRLKAAQQAASLEQAASECDVLAVRRWLVREVVLSYSDVRIADDQQFDNRRAQSLQQLMLKAEEAKLAAGIGTRADVREAQRGLSELLDAEAVLQRDRDLALARLAVLLGKSPAEVQLAPVDGYFGRLTLSGAVSPRLSASIVAERPDVAAAWKRVVAANVEARRAQLERYPALTLTSSAGFMSDAVRRWLTGDAVAWLAQAALQSPLLDAGRIKARTDLAVAALAEQNASYRKTVLQAVAEVGNTLGETLAARQRLELAEEERQRRTADRNAVRSAVRTGSVSRPTLLQSERALLDASSAHGLRRYELMTVWVATQKALGQ